MKQTKTYLAQAQEYNREMEDMLLMIESYKNKINESLAVPSRMFGNDFRSSYTPLPSKPTLIKIDVTKLP